MPAARILRFEVMTNEESTDHIPRFDRREMLIIHDLFRREFALMPGLVATVPLGDRDRAGLIGDHIDTVDGAAAPSPQRGRRERLAVAGGSMRGVGRCPHRNRCTISTNSSPPSWTT